MYSDGGIDATTPPASTPHVITGRFIKGAKKVPAATRAAMAALVKACL